MIAKATSKEAQDNATIIANSPTPQSAVENLGAAAANAAARRKAAQEVATQNIRRQQTGNAVPAPATPPAQAPIPFTPASANPATGQALPRFRANPDGTFSPVGARNNFAGDNVDVLDDAIQAVGDTRALVPNLSRLLVDEGIDAAGNIAVDAARERFFNGQ